MKFFAPLFVWSVMGAILVTGILLAVAGKGLWLLVLGVLGFILLVAKYGCLSQH